MSIHNTTGAIDTMAQQPVVNQSPFDNIDTEIERDGRKIVLPALPQDMTYDEGILALMRKKKEEEELVAVHERVPAFYYDGLVAFGRAMREQFGWTSAVPVMTWFGPEPPSIVSVDIGFDEQIPCIEGKFQAPGVEGDIYTNDWKQDGRRMFAIVGQVKRKHAHVIAELAMRTKKFVKEHSIYRSKAIILRTDDAGDLLPEAPKFFNLRGADDLVLIFSDDVQTQIDVNLLTPIRRTQRARSLRIPLKRGVLLAGKYGTGKTLTASITAKECVANGWTFILLDRVAGLKDALALARLYQPCVVFAEDIDRAMAGQERTSSIDDILNTIDGVESKNTEVFTVLTTNHMEEINQAMLRPGRLDAVIEILPPDAKAAQRLMQHYSGGLIPAGTELPLAGEELAGQIPATIREVTERAKLYALTFDDGTDGVLHLTDEALVASAKQMKAHLALLNRETDDTPSPEERYGIAARELFQTIASGLTYDDRQLLEKSTSYSSQVFSAVQAMRSDTKSAAQMVTSATNVQTKKLEAVKNDTETILTHVVD